METLTLTNVRCQECYFLFNGRGSKGSSKSRTTISRKLKNHNCLEKIFHTSHPANYKNDNEIEKKCIKITKINLIY